MVSEVLFYPLGHGMIYDSKLGVLTRMMVWLVFVCGWVGDELECKYLRNNDQNRSREIRAV